MFCQITTTSLLIIISFSLARGIKSNYTTRTDTQQEEAARFGFLNDLWDRDVSDNEVSNSRMRTSSNSIQHQRINQQDYSCGRAIANKKYKDLLLRDQSYQIISSTRPKYRPIEIRMPRIIGGDETAPGEFPWTASVKLNGQPICGGSLIEKSWILTAAHCVVGYNPKNLTVRLGAYRIKDTSETQTVDLPVSMFIVHKDYSMPRPFSNDIALLKLNEPVEYTDFIIPICLPTEDQITSSTLSNLVISDDNRFETGKEDSEGIVVSTKMSDNDIADCFTRLEQNYLNSIGLGSSASEQATTEGGSPNLSPPLHADPPPQSSTNQLFSYGNLLDSVFVNNDNKDKMPQHKITFVPQKQQQQQQQQRYKPAVQNFELPISIESNHLGTYPNQGNFILYGLPWNRKNEDLSGKYGVNDGNLRKDPLKLSRLPISKELLKEIQSIGSGPMPSLNLGLDQGDLVAMASDLTQTEGNSGTDIRSSRPDGLHSSVNAINNLKSDVLTEYSGLKGIVVGWGWIRELDGDEQINTKGYPSVTLQKVELPILRNNVCEAWFQSQAKKITLLPSQFCAGFNSGGKDACRGDSGGPMIIEDNTDTGRYKLIGIVSAGIGCARPSLPGLYTRVASFIPWINAQIVRY